MDEKRLKLADSMWYRYLKITKGVEYIEEGKKFIVYKDNNGTLEIHDVYSEEGLAPLMEMTNQLVERVNPLFVEGYIDKDYEHFERSHYMLTKFGMKPYRETEDYIYYIKKVEK